MQLEARRDQEVKQRELGGRAIETAIARNGARMAGRINHPVSVTGIDAVVPQIAAAAQSGQVDAVFMTANNQAVLPYLTERLAAAGVRSPVTQMMGLTRWDQPPARIGMAQLQEGWFAIPDQGLRAQFDARYRSAYGEQPHELASLAYDGVAAIAANVDARHSVRAYWEEPAAAAERLGRQRNALTTTGLTQRAGFAGVGGVFRLRPDGTSERALAVATLRGNRVVILDPAQSGFGRAGF